MAVVLVPGVAQTKLEGTVNANPWALIWHWRFGTSTANWASADLSTLANTVFNSWKSRFGPLMANYVTSADCQAVDIGTSTPNTGSSTGASAPGGSTGTWTPSVAILINFHIAARYRGGHPRTYTPGPYANASTDNKTVTSAAQTAYATAMVGLVTDVVTALPGSGAGAANHCVPLYQYTYALGPSGKKVLKERTALKTVVTVSSYTVHANLASQRRRLRTG